MASSTPPCSKARRRRTQLRLRSIRHLLLVPGAWRTFQCEPALLPREAAHLERLRRASKPRFLEAALRNRVSEAHYRAQPQRRWLVRPGRLRGPDPHLRDAEAD